MGFYEREHRKGALLPQRLKPRQTLCAFVYGMAKAMPFHPRLKPV